MWKNDKKGEDGNEGQLLMLSETSLRLRASGNIRHNAPCSSQKIWMNYCTEPSAEGCCASWQPILPSAELYSLTKQAPHVHISERPQRGLVSKKPPAQNRRARHAEGR